MKKVILQMSQQKREEGNIGKQHQGQAATT
jgi:hypothetical protein